VIGYPVHEVQRFNEWNVDELIYLDISRSDRYDLGRGDHRVANLTSPLDILEAVAEECFVPLTFGGRIRTVHDMAERFRRGADKVAVNTAAFDDPTLVSAGAERFGSQAIVVSIDAVEHDSSHEVVVDGGRRRTGMPVTEWAHLAERAGAGEILLNSVDRDGTGVGYDLALIRAVVGAVSVPVIACGGVGTYEDFAPAITSGGASAVAAANIFHFKELSDRNAKRAMARAGINVRL
jgi:imidazole glycerol-phosphate synthase subunit HisF